MALVDALSKETISEDVRNTFALRSAKLEIYPLSSRTMTQLQDVLVSNIDVLAIEATAVFQELDEPTAETLLARLDARVATEFPAGSQFFLMRLSEDTLRRPESDVRTSILKKARELKKEGASMDDTACQVVRRLRYQSIDDDECVFSEKL